MMEKCDVAIDCFRRPWKLEHIRLGPIDLSNNSLIYTRVSEFGQIRTLREYVKKYIKELIFVLKEIHNIIHYFKLKWYFYQICSSQDII